jgi:M6 family metalloprotease-like protein
MNKRQGLAIGVCASLLFIVSLSSSSTASQISSTKCAKAGTLRTSKNVRYLCKKTSKGLRWALASANSVSSTTTTTTIAAISPVITNVESCRLKEKKPRLDVSIGFPKVENRLRSTGGVRLGVFFADFPDSVATKTTESVLQMISPESETLYSKMSYGRVAFELVPVHRWIRMSKDSSLYGMSRGLSFATHRAYLDEVLRQGTVGLDTTTLDGFIVLTNPDSNAISNGPAFTPIDKYWGIQIGTKLWMNGTNSSGIDLRSWGFKWMNHEIGHTMGLVDLYAYSGSAHRFVGGWSLMGLISGHGPEYFAWERWVLNWLDDTQVVCLPSGSITATLNAVPLSGGQKMIVAPISDTRAVVVEVRRRVGYDLSLPEEGPLVYLVDTSRQNGDGVIKVLPLNDSDLQKTTAPLSVGETLTFEGVSVLYNSRTSYGDQITVNRN